MDNTFLINSNKKYNPSPEENIFTSLFKQYESVIVESLISSFGLNFIMEDRKGGDVDTLKTVRSEDVGFKNERNKDAYENRGDYNSAQYHSADSYKARNKAISEAKDAGILIDSYTGQRVARNADIDLDHVIAAKEIHDDPARTLAGLSGVDLANSDDNLMPTDRSINRSMKEKNADDYLAKISSDSEKRKTRIAELKSLSKLTDKERKELNKLEKIDSIDPERLKAADENARASYNAKLEKAYYTSPAFMKDISKAAANTAVKMGVKQVMGFVFAEVWFAVKDEFIACIHCDEFEMRELFKAISNGVKTGFENALIKYNALFERLKDGAITGAISSLTTTLCNVFFVTSKNTVRIIRETYSSLIQAAKVLFFNPDELLFGERMRTVSKILATGASIIAGTMVSEVIGDIGIGALPIIGEIVQTFCGTMITGILTCTLLFALDRSPVINSLVFKMNMLALEIDASSCYYREQAECFERLAAELKKIDIEKFRKETSCIESIAAELEKAENEDALNSILHNAVKTIGANINMGGYSDVKSLMADKKAVLTFG